jgi:hypothetical protein
VAVDEIVDPRAFAEILRQWSTLHPEFAFLPRKFKIAISGAQEDRAATAWHDVGLQVHRNAAGEVELNVSPTSPSTRARAASINVWISPSSAPCSTRRNSFASVRLTGAVMGFLRCQRFTSPPHLRWGGGAALLQGRDGGGEAMHQVTAASPQDDGRSRPLRLLAKARIHLPIGQAANGE